MPHDNVDLRATAGLPGLDIEIVHRRSSNRDREEIYLNLAAPCFEPYSGFLPSANPFLFWAEVTKLLWLEAARMIMLPSSAARLTNNGSIYYPSPGVLKSDCAGTLYRPPCCIRGTRRGRALRVAPHWPTRQYSVRG